MAHSLLPAAFLIGCGLMVGAAASPPATPTVVGRSLGAAPQSRMEGTQAIDDAMAAAVIGAISGEFSERDVQVKLDQVSVAPAGMAQRDLSGAGRLLIGKDAQWIPFHFTALYDTAQASVSNPGLTLGGGGEGHAATIQSSMGRRLTGAVDARLHAEFGQQPSRFAPESVRVIPLGARYLRVEASGLADFGPDGTTPAGVHGLYDQRNGRWVRLAYELGATADRTPPASAVASR